MRSLLLMVASCMVIIVSGCASDPGSMAKSDVEAKLIEVLHLVDVFLVEQPEGGYSGAGKRADGTKYTIVVAQKKDERSLWYTATSERGELEAGGFQQFGPPWLKTANLVRKGVMLLMILFVVAGSGYVVARKFAYRAKR